MALHAHARRSDRRDPADQADRPVGPVARQRDLVTVMLVLFAGLACAQAPATQAPPRTAAAVLPLDRVLVVVNDEAITQWDLNEQRRVVLQQLKASNVTPPPADILDKQVL